MKDKSHVAKGEITPLTMAIMPRRNERGGLGSYVLENNEKYSAKDPPSKLIDLACKFFGSSLRGRQIGTKAVVSMTHKLPISIDPVSGMYFFPTMSPTNADCIWIAHSHIKTVVDMENQRTKIVFKNGQSIIVDISYGSIKNQINRTAQYRYTLGQRIKGLYPKED